MREVEIFDTTLRDGEQSVKGGFKHGIESKLEIARMLRDLNVATIEAGYPSSSDGDFEAVSAIAHEIEGPYIAALAHMDKDAIARAWQAVRHSAKPTVHIFTYMVDPDSLQAYGKDFGKIIGQAVDIARFTRDLVKGRVEFSAQNATLAPREQVFELYEKIIAEGIDIVNLPDTSGYSQPDEIFDFFADFRKNVKGAGGVIISSHAHNDLGNATANSNAAVRAGAGQVECTINGLGERAGNAALEEVVMNIWKRGKAIGNTRTSIRTPLLMQASRIVSSHSGYLVQPNKPIVGENAFRHSSGIHQDGVAKGAIYEIMPPEIVGWDGESFELTARSGKKGVWYRLNRMGYCQPVEWVQANIMPIYKPLADEKGRIDDIDLRCLMEHGFAPTMEYKDHELVKNRRTENYESVVDIVIDSNAVSSDRFRGNGGFRISNHAVSEGAVDALFTAVDSVMPFNGNKPVLVDYNPVNVGTGHATTAEVTVILTDNRNDYKGDVSVGQPVYVGRARHKDTLTASVMAYVQAMDKYRQAHSE